LPAHERVGISLCDAHKAWSVIPRPRARKRLKKPDQLERRLEPSFVLHELENAFPNACGINVLRSQRDEVISRLLRRRTEKAQIRQDKVGRGDVADRPEDLQSESNLLEIDQVGRKGRLQTGGSVNLVQEPLNLFGILNVYLPI